MVGKHTEMRFEVLNDSIISDTACMIFRNFVVCDCFVIRPISVVFTYCCGSCHIFRFSENFVNYLENIFFLRSIYNTEYFLVIFPICKRHNRQDHQFLKKTTTSTMNKVGKPFSSIFIRSSLQKKKKSKNNASV